MSMYTIVAIILYLAGIIFSIITLIKRSDEPRNFIYAFIACICFFGSIVLIATNLCQKNKKVEIEVHSIITKNYEDCTFADDNTFYWHDKVYEYKLNENGNQVNIIYQEDGTKKVATYKLEKSK